MNDLQKAMENLRADEGLKQRTLDSIQKQALHRRSSHSHRSRFVAALCSFVLLLVRRQESVAIRCMQSRCPTSPSISILLLSWRSIIGIGSSPSLL